MKLQHRKQGNREHVQYVQCAVCIVRTVYSTCKWDRIVRTVVQYVLWCHTSLSQRLRRRYYNSSDSWIIFAIMFLTWRRWSKLIDIKYKGSKKLTWTPESIEAFYFCRIAVSNCQELYFLEDSATPILQTDASDYGIGGYMYMVTNGSVRVIRFFSKSFIGSQLNWSAREKECYGVKLLWCKAIWGSIRQ